MKSSNPQVMVQAYRLLVQRLDEGGFKPYPLHLGVTEAGDGEDGRIKSSVGIGTLLEDGLGDTIRVSLTEEPEAEVPVAITLANRYTSRPIHELIPEIDNYPINSFEYTRRVTAETANFGGHQVPRIIADFTSKQKVTPASLFGVGYIYSVPLDKWTITDIACDYVFLGDNPIDFEIPGTLGLIYNHKTWLNNKAQIRSFPFIRSEDYLREVEVSPALNFVYATLKDVSIELINKLKSDATAILLIDTYNKHGMAEQRRLFMKLMANDCRVPVVIGRAYGNLTPEQLQIYAGTDAGGLLVDGLGDGIFLAAENCGGDKIVNETAFNILQATRTRISKTEYISCPSCGRTLFDLQETTGLIRSRTNHLKGLKIGIMGCIVNGPGEMADADYGYVGSGPGRITLYRGKEVVKRNVPAPKAVDELIDLIRGDGNWIEPE
jgi:(E)-4-hydroxy-3-methylbut-2-enyl-diphosphate synthase